VVERGTGRIVASVGKPLAGKTGTSNDSKDTWFDGFSPDLAVSVFVGFDEPASLGEHETGATAAAPIFRDFMAEALKDKPPTPFRAPPGIRLVRVNANTGRLAEPGDKAIYEAFKPDTVPSGGQEDVLENDAGVMGLGYSPSTDMSRQEGDGAEGAAGQPLSSQASPEATIGVAPAPAVAAPRSSLAPITPVSPTPAPAQGAQPQAGGLY
jgi:penicillin-binding protein 1A